MTDVKFDPNIKDGRGTRVLAIPKSNGANTVDEPPFEAYAVTCGLTFNFGGLNHRRRANPPVRGRRAGGRGVVLQLSGRHRPDHRRATRGQVPR